jgi:hypothetical protein
MIGLDDFRPEHQAALDAAAKFRKRAEKGIPPDRWADGTAGQRLVAQGIAIMEGLLETQADVIRAMIEADRQRGIDAMEMHGKRRDAEPRL